MSSISARWLVVSVCFMLGLARAGAVDWPEGYIVDEDSVSPDGHYGIAIPESDDVAKEQPNPKVEEYYALNYLADVKNHTLLGKIRGSDYFAHQNHAGLTVQWSEDSKIGIVDYESRYGFASIEVLQVQGGSFSQTDLGEHIQKAIDDVIKKQSHGHEEGGYVSPLFRFEPGPKIRVYAPALTNPKQLEDTKSYFALFQGLFDLSAKKWIKSAARPITADENDLLDRASNNCEFDKFKVSPEPFKGLTPDAEEPQYSGDYMVFRSEESEFKYLDNEMNDVYKAARVILSEADFEKVRIAQREWLKKRDASHSIAEKSKLTAKRIDELQDASW